MKAWIVGERGQMCCVLVHAKTAGKAKQIVANEFDFIFTDVRSIRLPGLDDKPITYDNAKDACFEYGEYDDDGNFIPCPPETFENYCQCEICRQHKK